MRDFVKRFRRFFERSPAERQLLVMSAVILSAIRFGFSFLPFRVLRLVLVRIPQAVSYRRTSSLGYAKKITWAVNTAGCYVPGVRCLERAIAAHLLLAYSGYPTRLCIGLERKDGGHLEGHAWIEMEGEVIIGNVPNLGQFWRLPDVRTLDELLSFCLAFQMSS